MAQKTKVNTPAAPSYVNFEPDYELTEEEAMNTFIIRLPGFTKKQLRVQVMNLRILTIRGVSLGDAQGTIRRRFSKQIKLPEGCDVNEIRAKFVNGELRVMMPKQVNQTQQQETVSALSDRTESEANQTPKTEGQETNDEHENTSFDKSKDYTFRLGSELARLQERKRVVLRFGTSLVAVVAIGAFVASIYDAFPSSFS